MPTHRWALWLRSRLVRETGVEARGEVHVVDLQGLIRRCGEKEPPGLSRGLLELLITEVIEADPRSAASFVNGAGRARAGAVRALAECLTELHRRGQGVPRVRAGAEGEACRVLRRTAQRLGESGLGTEGAREHAMLQVVTTERLREVFGEGNLAIVDGFDEFDARFQRVLGALRAWAHDVVVLVDDTPERPPLRRHMEPVIDQLIAEADDAEPVQEPPLPPLIAAFGGGDERRLADGAAPQVEFQVCRTPHDEAVWIAREIKRWARRHPEESLSRIAVTFADPERMAPTVREVFTAWGLPFNTSVSTEDATLAATPLGQAALSVWRVAAGDFDRRDLAALARSRVWRGVYRLDADAVEREGRELRVARGLDLWRQRLSRAEETTAALVEMGEEAETESGVEIVELRRRRLARLRRLRRGLERLAGDVTPLGNRARLSDLLTALRELLLRRHVLERLLLMAASGPDESVRFHLQSFAALEGLIQRVDEARGVAPRELPSGDALHLAQRLMEATPLERRPPDTQAVQVLGRYELRGVPWAMVCVGGLNEGAWPRARRPSPFGESSPLAVNAVDPEVDLARQRHAFYQILRCDAKRLLLTRPAVVDDIPQNPSPFLEEVAELLGQARKIGTEGEKTPPWKVEQVASVDECFAPRELQWIAGNSLDRSLDTVSAEELRARLVAAGKSPLGAALAPVLRGIEIVQARRSLRVWSRWEGCVADASVRAALAERTGEHVWSATELEAFSACAWRGTVQRLLGLSEPLDEEEASVHALERGQLIHRILCDFLRRWRGQTRRPRADVRPAETEAAWSLMRRVADEHLASTPPGALLWEIEREILLGGEGRLGVLKAFVDEEAHASEELAPMHLEWRFGWPAHRSPPPLSEGQGPPVEIPVEGRTHRVRGVIDRIECSSDELRWAVVDYKTGTTEITAPGITAGLHLQLPLYALAVERLLARGENQEVVSGAIRRVVRPDKMGTKRILDGERGRSLMRAAMWHLDRVAQSVGAGDLHWTTRRTRDVCERCAWRHTCRRETAKVEAIGPPPAPPQGVLP